MNIKKTHVTAALGGLAAGTVNGLFGAGGGMLLLPVLSAQCEDRARAHATCLCAMSVLSAVSAGLYALDESMSLTALWPYLGGGLVGGCIGALALKKIPPKLLRRAFGLVVLAAGLRLLLR